jgi:hypothetical protein
MAVAIGALSEDAMVLFRRPGVVPVVVGGGKFGFAGEQDHVCFAGDLLGEIVSSILMHLLLDRLNGIARIFQEVTRIV